MRRTSPTQLVVVHDRSSALGELELVTGVPIRLQTEALYGVDQYDVVLM